MAKPAGYLKSVIAGRLLTAMNNFVVPRRSGLVSGEAGMMRLSPGRVRLPDEAFVSVDRLPGRRAPTEPVPSLSPDLAVEVLSPGNTRREIEQKIKEYFTSGTRLVWIIDPPMQSVTVYRRPEEPRATLTPSANLDGLDVLPGFAVSLTELFDLSV